MTALLVNIDDPFFARIAIELQTRTSLVGAIVTHRPDQLSRAGTDADVDIIDARALYRHADVAQLLEHGRSSHGLSDSILRELLECEHYFLTITDRTQTKPRSVTSRRHLFRDLVSFWLSYLERRKDLDVVWFESTPHMGWDLVLFYVARMLGRRTSILARTLLDDRVYFHDDFRTELPIVLPAGNTAELEAMAGSELVALVGRSSSWLEMSQRYNAQALRQESLVERAKVRVHTIIKMAQSLVKPAEFLSATAGDEPMLAAEMRMREIAFRRELRALKRCYDSLARPASLDGPFIYFSMHYQPERTSQPEALLFDDHLLAIDLIARSLPPGWRVLVKEHPRQFGLYPAVLRRRHARKQLDYAQIAALANVQIVPVDTPSGALIDACRLTATLTGTAGWEGLLAGKPSLVFGPSWYSRCRSVTIVRSQTDVMDAIARTEQSNTETVRNDVLALLSGLRPRLFRSSTSEKFARASKASYDELARGLVEALSKELTPVSQRLAETEATTRD